MKLGCCFVKKGDRIAQVVLVLVYRIPGIGVGEARMGGFGSTGTAASKDTSESNQAAAL
jgi:hypothetical protein